MEQENQYESKKFKKNIPVKANNFGSDYLELGGRQIISVAYQVEEGKGKKVFCTRAYPNDNLTSWDMEFYNSDANNDYNVVVEGVIAIPRPL